MRLQLWHMVVLTLPVIVAVLLFLVVRKAARDGAREASRSDRAPGR